MNIEYLKFRGYTAVNQAGVKCVPNELGDIDVKATFFPSIENSRTLTVNKDDVQSIYSYAPESVSLPDLTKILSFRVVLGLRNQGYLELQIVADVPVNAVIDDPNNVGQAALTSNASGIRALTLPFSSAYNTDLSPSAWTLGPVGGSGNSCAAFENIAENSTIPAINGKQYQWTKKAIAAYFGIFGVDAVDISLELVVSNWLEQKISDYLVANPGGPITDVDLGEVKDFVYDDGNGPVTYGGFKLRFGGVGEPCALPDSLAPIEGTGLSVSEGSTVKTGYPFRWSDVYVGPSSAGGPGGGEPS